IDNIIITASKEDEKEIKALVSNNAKVVLGGKTRTESVKNALNEIEDGIVLIHDGARPFCSQRIINEIIESVKTFGSGITAIPTRDTVCMVEDNKICGYVGKEGLYQVQTPQAFLVKDIKKAYEKAGKEIFNDDGEVYLEHISTPHLVVGDKNNIKLTYHEDFEVFNDLGVCRVGVGFDCHKLVENRKLILGGITIPHDKGLLGHSDADVLTHAIMDAILASASMRDIGFYFPDKDPKYKDADSILLLKEVLTMIYEKGLKVKSISATIMAEKPKLLNHIPNIVSNLSKVLEISTDNIGILATTLEGLGFVGREEGICVSASAVLIKK
ncbi:MAG: 2-C-methyl-D-erythritol 2,4-cyclodiphosphate synthase, partial [Firmicutes bacterium]|nr:2-C-methyl-D-erythritol 2,4-cyclodiphosphate synthase [Candidatus Caballimonas caccae]